MNATANRIEDALRALDHSLQMIEIVDQGCGGNLTFKEMAESAMRQAKAARVQLAAILRQIEAAPRAPGYYPGLPLVPLNAQIPEGMPEAAPSAPDSSQGEPVSPETLTNHVMDNLLTFRKTVDGYLRRDLLAIFGAMKPLYTHPSIPQVAVADEYMCPNCQTPWKCNGPHIPRSASKAAEPVAAQYYVPALTELVKRQMINASTANELVRLAHELADAAPAVVKESLTTVDIEAQARHWRQAITEENDMPWDANYLDWIEQRARSLAQAEQAAK